MRPPLRLGQLFTLAPRTFLLTERCTDIEAKATLLHDERDVAVHDVVIAGGSGLLHASKLRRESLKSPLGITVLLSFSVFQLLVAEVMPETSDNTPAISEH